MFPIVAESPVVVRRQSGSADEVVALTVESSRPRRIGAIVLGWNLREESLACLASLKAQGYPALELIYVDNGSTDGAPELVRERFPEAEVVELGANVGIAAGYNAGLARAVARGVDDALVLNNDTLFAPGCLRALAEAADAQPEAGVLMPKIVYESERDRIWSIGARRRRFPPGIVMVGLNRRDGDEFSQDREIESAPSCALLIGAETLRRVGYFDPGYFFYFDDADYCARVRRAGLRIRYVANAVVWHKVSLSTARSVRPARWWYIMGRSAALFYRRYYRPTGLALGAYAGWFALRETLHGHARFVPLFVRGVVDGVVDRPYQAPGHPR